MTFREDRHAIFAKAIRETVEGMNRTQPTKALAADLLPLAFKLYQQVDLPFSDATGDRTKRDVYLSAIRQTALSFERSWLNRTACRILKLDPVLDALAVYTTRLGEFSRCAALLTTESIKYDKFRADADSIAAKYPTDEYVCDLCRLYASLKAWKSNDDLVRTQGLIAEYSRMKVELILEGPIRLLLQITEDGFLVIWRALSWQGGRDEPKMRDGMVLTKDIYALFKRQDETGIVREFLNLLNEAISRYSSMWLDKQRKLRVWVRDDTRDRFFRGFEDGIYFKHVENAR